MAHAWSTFGSSDGSCWWLRKLGFTLVSGAALTAVAYVVYRYCRRRDDRDEGFFDVAKTEEPAELKVLVLGLDGAGKSSIVHALSGHADLTDCRSDSFNVVSLNWSKQPLSLWEIGGAPSVRKYWSSFVQDTRILVYVVDSTDEKRLPEAFNELHRILGDERLIQVPIIIVANKQDMFGALDRDTILSSLAMDRINRQRRCVDYVATQAPPSGSFVGINELKTLLDHLSSCS